MPMRPNKAETAVHGCHYPGDMAVVMRKVGVGVCHLFSLLSQQPGPDNKKLTCGKLEPGQWSTAKITWQRALNWSPRYGHVIVDSGYRALTGVKTMLYVLLRDFVVVGTRPRAVALAVMTFRRAIHGFV